VCRRIARGDRGKDPGGRPATEANGKIERTTCRSNRSGGETVWEWRVWDHLDPAEFPIAVPENPRADWTHGNTVVELADGNLSNISTIVRIDRRSGKVVWTLRSPVVSGQHAPTPLANGNILIFDNGPHRLDQTFPFSRVIEVHPATNEIVWKYQEAFPQNFYSDRISNAQRLPNGNTLINEGMSAGSSR
jgi:hypothetical protein